MNGYYHQLINNLLNIIKCINDNIIIIIFTFLSSNNKYKHKLYLNRFDLDKSYIHLCVIRIKCQIL